MRRRKTQNYNTLGGDAEKTSGEEQGADAQAGEAQGDESDGNGADGMKMNGAGPPANGAADDLSPATAGALPEATPEERIAALEAERDDLKDRMLRIAAEFENWKKRASKTQTDAVTDARERVLKDMLEVVDNLERAVSMQPGGDGGDAVLKGVDLVLRVLKQKLERHDVKAFDAAGQPFDPRVHEAISRIASADVPAGSVAVELQKGYRVGERLLRPALVSVSSGPATA
jgi:molecular chaperone GrpE